VKDATARGCDGQPLLPGSRRSSARPALSASAARWPRAARAAGERLLERHGIRGLLDVVVGRDDVRNVKPDPELFLLAASRLGKVPEACVVFEDSPNGMRAALAAGMRCVAVPNALTRPLERPRSTSSSARSPNGRSPRSSRPSPTIRVIRRRVTNGRNASALSSVAGRSSLPPAGGYTLKKSAPRVSLLLVALAVALVAPPRANPQADSPPDPLARTLDAMLTGLYAKDVPGAAVIAVRDGRTVLRKAYGMADLELGVPLQPDMVFRIGSMTKQFTAVAILMLVEEARSPYPTRSRSSSPTTRREGRRSPSGTC